MIDHLQASVKKVKTDFIYQADKKNNPIQHGYAE